MCLRPRDLGFFLCDRLCGGLFDSRLLRGGLFGSLLHELRPGGGRRVPDGLHGCAGGLGLRGGSLGSGNLGSGNLGFRGSLGCGLGCSFGSCFGDGLRDSRPGLGGSRFGCGFDGRGFGGGDFGSRGPGRCGLRSFLHLGRHSLSYTLRPDGEIARGVNPILHAKQAKQSSISRFLLGVWPRG